VIDVLLHHWRVRRRVWATMVFALRCPFDFTSLVFKGVDDKHGVRKRWFWCPDCHRRLRLTLEEA